MPSLGVRAPERTDHHGNPYYNPSRGRHFCGPQHRRPHQGSTDHQRVVKAAKAGGQKKKEIKRFNEIKALHLTLASSPGVGKIIRKMVMTKDEQRFEEEADKARASLGDRGRSQPTTPRGTASYPPPRGPGQPW
ncbi:Hypp6540 [Branchiostoma lanceolatum]|uniref:Hypp6540 protein n=1 Tax=Branchiostoma lanceolatum TaxID=7740 RepID=A0A8J9YV48_BRALA|nr:Hypp6540 [Branchiostoma lanceolatum]